MAATKIPGLGAAIVKGDHVAWTHGYGKADVAANKPVTADTIFMLASVSTNTVTLEQVILYNWWDPAIEADVTVVGDDVYWRDRYNVYAGTLWKDPVVAP